MLHVLTSDAIVARPDFADTAERVIAAMGAQSVFHLRTRLLAGDAYVRLARRLAAVAHAHGTMLVINARCDVAMAAGADGVQLGRGSLSPAESKAIAPALRIGVSVHTISDVSELSRSMVDWIVAGHVFETPSHRGEPPRGIPFIQGVAAATNLPVIAVGGIRPEHRAALYAAGAAGVAVISGIWDTHRPDEAVNHYL